MVRGYPRGSVVENLPAEQETRARSLVGKSPHAWSSEAREPWGAGSATRRLCSEKPGAAAREEPRPRRRERGPQPPGPRAAPRSSHRPAGDARRRRCVCAAFGHSVSVSLQVVFDDLGQSLIRLSSPDLQFQLIAAFLQFLGVPSGFRAPASCLYLAMDENSIFDNELYDEKPLTLPDLSCSGVGCVGCMEPLGGRRWPRGPSREGEEFIRNVFHLALPLFAGRERSQLCVSWLRYEITKVTPCPPPLGGDLGSCRGGRWGGQAVFCRAPAPVPLQGPKGTARVAAPSEGPQGRGRETEPNSSVPGAALVLTVPRRLCEQLVLRTTLKLKLG